MEVDHRLRAICLALVTDNISSERFNQLLLRSGIRLDTTEWDIANQRLGTTDDIMHALVPIRTTLQ